MKINEKPVPGIVEIAIKKKLEMILIKRCPDSKLAKSRIAKLNSLDIIDKVSTKTNKGNKNKGMPEGINKHKKFTPL
jgi:hypothetical protein